MTQPTPAIVTQSAVRRLPRLALALFCLAYVLPGFLGREPWKTADVASLGAMLDLAQGLASAWHPTVLGAPVDDMAWLPYWLGALFVVALPFLPPELAARLPFAGLLGLTLACTWYATYHLARHRAAQPVAFAFGGEAHPTDYARALADAGLLALLACLGLAQLSHETTPDVARLAFAGCLLWGAARLSHGDGLRQMWRGVALWGLGTIGLALSGAAGWGAVLAGGLLVWLVMPGRRAAGTPLGPVRTALLVGLWATLPLSWALLPAGSHATVTAFDAGSWAQLLVWFTWPAWPLALWTLWRWRRQAVAAHVALPLWSALVLVVASALAPDDRDRALLPALPALAVLAAFALPTLRRSVSALVDWFTLLFFTFCAVAIWVVWTAMQTGVPAKPAANVAKLAPGFVPEFSAGLFLLAMLATVAWIGLVAWRVGRHRQALWKSLVLPAAGSTLCWLLLMTLWLPLLDFGRSYGPLSRRVATLVPPGSCVLVDGLNQAQIAALRHHGGLELRRTPAPAGDCLTLIVAPAAQPTLDQRVTLTDWAFRATVRRLTDTKESVLVYQRIGLAGESAVSPPARP